MNIESNDYKTIESLRIAMGTLPSEHPVIKTNILSFHNSVEVTLEDYSHNPYKTMFCCSTSTWGDNEFKSKWPKTSLEGKLAVIQAVLTHKTLPQAKEMVQFLFRVKGVPRWLFDYHTQVPFTSFQSIGCRDNNKSDCDIVKDKRKNDEEIFKGLKSLYTQILSDNQGTWQSARSFLPQSYSHSYHFGQNLLSIVGTKGFHASKDFNLKDEKDFLLCQLYKIICNSVKEKFPLIGMYLEILFYDNEIIFEKLRSLTIDQLDKKDYELFLQN